jgi:hypothetical protein
LERFGEAISHHFLLVGQYWMATSFRAIWSVIKKIPDVYMPRSFATGRLAIFGELYSALVILIEDRGNIKYFVQSAWGRTSSIPTSSAPVELLVLSFCFLEVE